MVWSTDGLTERERTMLDVESKRWKFAGAKDSLIFDLFRCSPTRYYQELDALIDRPEALKRDPLTVKRLQRLRDKRREARTVGFGT